MSKRTPVIENIIDYNSDGTPLVLNSREIYGLSLVHGDDVRRFPAVYLVIAPDWKDRIGGNLLNRSLRDTVSGLMDKKKIQANLSQPFYSRELDRTVIRVYSTQTAVTPEVMHAVLRKASFCRRALVGEHPPAQYSAYESLLEAARKKQRPINHAFEGLLGPNGLIPISFIDAERQIAKIAKTTPVAVKHMRAETCNLSEEVAQAIVRLANVPPKLKERYTDLLTGIPHHKRLLGALIKHDETPFAEVHVSSKRAMTAFENSKTRIGQIALLYKLRNKISQDDLGLSHTTVSEFERGIRHLNKDTASIYADTMQYEKEDRRAFILMAQGKEYLTHDAILKLMTDKKARLSQSELLETLIEQSIHIDSRAIRKWGYESQPEMMDKLEYGLKNPSARAAEIAKYIGFNEAQTEQFSKSFIEKFKVEKEGPQAFVKQMQSRKITFLQGVRALILASGNSYESFCTKINMPQDMLYRERLAQKPVIRRVISILASDLSKTQEEFDPAKFTTDMQLAVRSEAERLGDGKKPFAERVRYKRGGAERS